MDVLSKIIKLPIYVRGIARRCRLLRFSRQQLYAKLLVSKRKHQGKAVTDSPKGHVGYARNRLHKLQSLPSAKEI